MIAWREKFRAFGLHLLATLVATLAAAALIFLVWYPEPFGRMVGGFKLFLLISGCDLALGPLLSLVVYNSLKTRLALVVDYTAIAIVQIAAFVYGVYSVSEARPAYVVFVKDRFEVVAAANIAEKDLQEAKGTKYGVPPKWGPELVAAYADPKDHNEILFAALEGRDIHVRPKFFVDYASQIEAVKKRAGELPRLEAKFPQAGAMLAETLSELDRPASDFGWLPVSHGKGFWTVLIDRATGYPAAYIPLDPF